MTLLLLLGGAGPAWAVPRESVLDLAAAYTTHEWTMTSANASIDCASGWESAYTPGDYVGLPYDWGGYVTLDEFDDQIADGYGAGSHSQHGSLWCTTGVDCSGFVSRVWATGHYSTSTFYEVTHDIGWDDLERADAVNDAGSHIVLYTHTGEDGWPVFYEASGGGEKVRLNSQSGWGYLDGYQPVRFDDIEDGPSTGTAAAPKEITAFPFTHLGATPGAASDVLDVYGCAPDADESGPEVLYHFTTATGGRLEALVSDADGVDVDLHVLTAAREDACLARDDTWVEVDVPAGDVWLALDTYVGSHEYSGPYLLTVDFTADAGGEDTGADNGGSENGGAENGGAENGGAENDEGETAGDTAAPDVFRAERMGEDPKGCGCASLPAGGPGSGGSGHAAPVGASVLLLAAWVHRRRS